MDTADKPSHPLRPYYVPPETTWSHASTPASSTRASKPAAAATLRMPATPSSSNRYASVDDYADPDALPAGTVLRAFFMSSLLSFTSTALVMPFEVGKTLAQVQWVPKDGLDPLVWAGADNNVSSDEEAVELDDEAEVDAYFSDLQARGLGAYAPPSMHEAGVPRPVSPSGYLKRAGVSDEQLGTKPDWVMPVVVQGGVWDMMKTVSRWKGEGWSSLWKGQVTTWFLDATSTAIQPMLFTAFTATFVPRAFAGLPIVHSPHPTPLLICSTLSHTLTSLLLSPLDLIRTRLVVQSAQPLHRKYSGPFDAFRAIMREEGGLWNTYFHPNLLIPTLLEGVLRPLIHLSTPLVISRYLAIEPSTSPVTFALAEFVFGTAALLVTIPLETVRKRLQIQTRAEFVRAGRPGGTGRAWRTCVETRPAPYAGVVEAVYRILTEETGRIPRRRRRSAGVRDAAGPAPAGGSGGSGSSNSSGSHPATANVAVKEDLAQLGLGVGSGLRQLYRGLSMGIGANAIVFLLSLVAGSEGSSAGWAEV